LRQTQPDLAHVSRVTTMGELTASLAHEIKQPIAAAVTDASDGLAAISPIWQRRAQQPRESSKMRLVQPTSSAGSACSSRRALPNKNWWM